MTDEKALTAGRIPPAVIGSSRLTHLTAYAALAAFYGLTMPANRFEVWDGYLFARQIETYGLTEVHDTRLLLFHAVMRLLYEALNGLGFPVSAHSIMLAVGILSAPLALILLHRFLAVVLSLAPPAAMAGPAFLGVSYGFWRYAGEAETYVPSIALILVVLTVVFAADRRAQSAGRRPLLIGPGILAGLAVLFYQPNAIPLFLALPIALLRRDRLLPLIRYGAAGVVAVIGGYALAYIVSQDEPLTVGRLIAFANNRADEFTVEPIGYRLIVDSLLSLAHDTASTNWIFGHPQLVALVERLMPGRIVDAAVYAASRAGFLIYLPFVTLPILALAGLWCVIVAFRKRRQARPFDRLTWFCLAWFALYALVVGRLDANSFEPWIMALPPFAILLGLFVFDPCAQAPGRSMAPLVLVTALFAHNAAAMAGIHSSAGDAFRAKNAWLIENATPEDLVVTPFRNFQFESFTLYHVPAGLVSVQRHGLEEVWRRIAAVQAAGGRVFAYDDLFEDLEILAARDPALAAVTEDWVKGLASRSLAIAENDAGKLYEIGPLPAGRSGAKPNSD